MATIPNDKTYFCKTCKRIRKADDFYTSNNLEKYPNEGKLAECKDCITMHVDNTDPDTYLWILQEADVPYIPDEWHKLMLSYTRDNKKITGKTILGRYLAKMQLKQFRDYRWKDSEFLQEMANLKIEQAMKSQGYGAAEIADVISHGTYTLPVGTLEKPAAPPPVSVVKDTFNEEEELSSDLTEDDKKYLRIKWGKAYKIEEWIKLEQLYNEMINSYDIQTAGHFDTLKLICKTSLKANQLIDAGDIEGFQKMSKVYDGLMKSGKFTAAQNKTEKGEFIDSISELVALCEREGFIPRYYVESPKDKVDETLEDFKNYVKTLVTEEMNLGTLIENAIKEMSQLERKEEDEDIEDELTLESIDQLRDADFEEYNEFIEDLEEQDSDYLLDLLHEESSEI